MANASVKVSANASTYQKEMKAAVEETKQLASQFNVASTKAKLFGTATDQLQTKQQALTAKITAQNKVTQVAQKEVQRLTEQLTNQKTRQEETAAKISKANEAYQKQAQATGENSNEAKALKAELQQLEKAQTENATAVARTETALTKTTQKQNESEVAAAKMEAELKKVNQQLKDKALDDFAAGLDKVSDKLDKVQKGANIVSGATVAIGGAALKAWSEADSGADKAIAATGKTGEAAEELNQSYKDVASSFAANFDDIGSTLGEVDTRFGLTGQAAEDCTTQFLKFAKVNGTDAKTAVQLVSRAMGDAGIDASEYGSVLDSLTAASQASGISIDELATNLTKYGAPMRALGFDTQSSIAIFSQWEKAGVNTEIAFSGMKKAISNWSSNGKDARVEFQKTLEEIKSAPDIASATTLAIEAFGQKAGPDLADAIQNGRFSYEEFMATLDASGGTLDATYGAIADGADETKIAMNNVTLAGAELGDTIQQKATPYIQMASEKIKELTTWIRNMDDGTKDTIMRVGLFAVGLAPAVMGVNALVKGVRGAIGVYKTMKGAVTAVKTALTSETAAKIAAKAAEVGHAAASGIATAATKAQTLAQGALNAVMAVNPIVWVVAAIAALVAGFVLAYNKCEWFRNMVDGAVAKVKEIFTSLKENVTKVFTGIKDAISEKFTAAKNKVSEIATGIKQGVAEKFNAIKQTIGTVMQAAKDTVQQKLNNIKNAYEQNGGGLKGVAAATMEGVKGYWTAGLTFVDNLTGGKLTQIKNAFNEKLGQAKSYVSEKFNGIKDTIGSVMETARGNVQQKLDNIKSAYEQNGGGIKGVVAGAMQGVKDTWSSAMNIVDNLTGGKLSEIQSAFSSKLQAAHDTVTGILDNIKNAFSSKLQAAHDVVSGIIDKIKSIFNFSWSFPPLKLPHFSISGSFSLRPPSVPHLAVDWYATGGVMTQPTLFGMNGSRAMVGGEAGPEAILPLTPFYRRLAEIIEQQTGQSTKTTTEKQLNINVKVEVSGSEDEAAIVQRVTNEVNNEIQKRGRVWN